MAAHMSAPSPSPFVSSNPYGSINNTHQHHLSSLLDPNVMMMTNAAATIAAVAASAVQHAHQAKAAPSHNSMQSSLSAAMNARNSLFAQQHHASAGAANPAASQLAALLGGSTSQHHHLQSPGATSLQQLLGLGETMQNSPAPSPAAALAPPAVSNVMVPSMQTWSLEQLGKNAQSDRGLFEYQHA